MTGQTRRRERRRARDDARKACGWRQRKYRQHLKERSAPIINRGYGSPRRAPASQGRPWSSSRPVSKRPTAPCRHHAHDATAPMAAGAVAVGRRSWRHRAHASPGLWHWLTAVSGTRGVPRRSPRAARAPASFSKPPTACAGLTEHSPQKFLSNLMKVNSGNGSLDQLYFVDRRSCFEIQRHALQLTH
jgi:hypothetical protein